MVMPPPYICKHHAHDVSVGYFFPASGAVCMEHDQDLLKGLAAAPWESV